jgi:hypothetical protein
LLFWTLFQALNVVVLILDVERFVNTCRYTPLHVGLATISFLAGVVYIYTLWSESDVLPGERARNGRRLSWTPIRSMQPQSSCRPRTCR